MITHKKEVVFMISTSTFDFSSPGNIHFEPGGSKKTGAMIKALGGKKVFLATDKGVLNANLLDGIVSSFKAEGLDYTLFYEIEPNPSLETVEKGFDLFKSQNCDALVGFGGGSPIDTAKAIGVLTTNDPPVKQYEGAGKVTNPVVPIVAVPTTAGTGSEVTGASVITDRSRNYKMSIRSPLLVPKIALLDPTLLCSLPPNIIASTGMDALVHAVESFISLNAFPVTEGLAIESMRLISANLRAFYANPDNPEAAGNMLIASCMAGISFANARLGFVHAVAHALGGHYNIPHGLACAVLLPHAMQFSLISNPQKYVRIAAAFGETTENLSLMQAAQTAVEAVKALSGDIGIPETLGQLGAKSEGVAQIAQDAIKSGIHLTTPRKIDLEGIESILRAAL